MIVIANIFPKLGTVKTFVRSLSKKRRFRTRFDSQHVKASHILAKSPSGRFFQVVSSFSGEMIWKMSPLALNEVLVVLGAVLAVFFSIFCLTSDIFQINFRDNDEKA